MHEYHHTLNNNPRFISARRTAHKVGSAYSGWAPKPRSAFANLLIDLSFVLIGLVIVGIAMEVYSYVTA